jgi:hypothetical protein
MAESAEISEIAAVNVTHGHADAPGRLLFAAAYHVHSVILADGRIYRVIEAAPFHDRHAPCAVVFQEVGIHCAGIRTHYLLSAVRLSFIWGGLFYDR